MNKCWCNKGQLAAFSDAYAVCSACKTLVSKKSHDAFNEKNFPKRQHVSSYSEDSLAKSLLWLTTILKYKASPVTLFDVSGIQQEFSAIMQSMQCDVFQTSKNGQLFDIVILINTLEYQTNPQATIKDALNALKPDGLLLIQTPNYPGLAEKNILQQEHAFASPLMTQEAHYLFNQASVQLLLKTLNLAHVEFQHTNKQLSDMLFVTSRVPLLARSEKAQTKSFNSTTAGRLISALATKQTQLQRLETQAQTLQVSKVNDSAHLSDIETLRNQLHISEEDRSARLVQIETLTAHIEKLSQNHATQIEHTTTQLAEFKANAATHCAQIETLTQALQTSETDRAARLTQIQTLGNQLQISETDRSTRLAQIESLTAHIHDLSKKHITQIEHLTEQLTQTQSNAAKNIEKLDNALQTSETDRAAQNTQINILHKNNNLQLIQVKTLTAQIKELQQKHAQKMEYMFAQLTEAKVSCSAHLANIERLTQTLQSSENNCKTLHHQLKTTEKNHEKQFAQIKALEKQMQAFEQHHTTQIAQVITQLKEAKSNRRVMLRNLFSALTHWENKK